MRHDEDRQQCQKSSDEKPNNNDAVAWNEGGSDDDNDCIIITIIPIIAVAANVDITVMNWKMVMMTHHCQHMA